MTDRPDAEALLRSVVRFLKQELMPSLDGAAAFKTRVAANALELAGREIEGRGRAEAAEMERLMALLNQSGNLDTLNRALCTAIASGHIGFDTPGLADHVWQTTLDKVAIDQPGYASYRRILEQRGGAGA